MNFIQNIWILALSIVVCLLSVKFYGLHVNQALTRTPNSVFKLGNMVINESGVVINDGIGLHGTFESTQQRVISDCSTSHQSELCLSYPHVEFKTKHYRNGKTSCYDVQWVTKTADIEELKDCFEIGEAHWYGGFQHVRQPWPLEKIDMEQEPYVSTDLFFHGKVVGGVQERLFFNSNGFGLFVPEDIPLFLSINGSGDKKICLSAKHDGFPYLSTNSHPRLAYTICHSPDVKRIRKFMLNRYLKTPTGIPDKMLFSKPIWCTWAQYNKQINESTVVEYAKTIVKHNFTHSQIEIDDDWTPYYGDLVFHNDKFSDPKTTIKRLNEMGFRITLWVHPFMELNSTSFAVGAKKGFLIKNRGSTVPALVKWWDGDMAGCLDVTNPEAVDWFLKKLRTLQEEFNISSFKFDAGESYYLPRNYDTKEPLKSPEEFARLWATIAYRSTPNVRNQEVRIGWKSQDLPIFVRMFDRASSWGDMAGIKTLIPTMLTFGIIGYPFVLADMVGGNAYNDLVEFKGGAYPNRELFIRWMEVNTFFPTIQYSIAPWIYDQEVIDLCKKYTDLHEEYSPLLIDLANQAVGTGDPIIRPLWWIAPHDEDALTIDDEFLVGDDLLVAPVLSQGQRSRHIYFPEGKWRDMLRGGYQFGPQWIENYTADLPELPFFIREVEAST